GKGFFVALQCHENFTQPPQQARQPYMGWSARSDHGAPAPLHADGILVTLDAFLGPALLQQYQGAHGQLIGLRTEMRILFDESYRTIAIEEGPGMVAQIPKELAEIAVQRELPDRVLELPVQNQELFNADETAVEILQPPEHRQEVEQVRHESIGISALPVQGHERFVDGDCIFVEILVPA